MNYKEKRFEEDIEHYLLNYGGYIKGDLRTYDRKRAIDMDKLVAFIQATQPKEWNNYVKRYGELAIDNLYKRFNTMVEKHGLLFVLRNGIDDIHGKFKIIAFRPETSINDKVVNDYNANIVTCTRQFKYSTQNENSIDMVLSINGIPLVALELKNQYTGQDINNAKRQFMNDRNPRELCFRFNTRFLVYFAVDLQEVAMTTQLKGKDTYFLPFNQGSNGAGKVGGAGNPANPQGYMTSYLWENVLHKDVLIDIIQRYLHLSFTQAKTVQSGKKQSTKQSLIFPRYHQLDVVTKLLSDVKKVGSGNNYLIQHSAGSGKSNSIAWLSYGLANLHNDNDEHIFNSIIVITDRKVLDSQLQKTISSFDHTKGLVATIGDDKTSKDLKEAINNGKRIIITTLQKFPFIYKEIDDNTHKKYAIIADEAHSSQHGTNAKTLKQGLADISNVIAEYAEYEYLSQDIMPHDLPKCSRELLYNGTHTNLSFFAFTATPKHKTLELFGIKYSDGSFHPYHVYSMRQAIEEGFIHDVLANYTTYQSCYKIAKTTPDNPEVPTNQAVKAIRRYASLHSHSLKQKTAIIIETFRNVTKHKINGRAKAMVVTSDRLHAVRYYHEFKNYLKKKNYDDLEILVAFSGVVKDADIAMTEESLNKRKDGSTIKENQLTDEFHKDEYAMLIVAEKYQTGFDEPLLHTMFVDKKLSGISAVQTLSRINRVCPYKQDTFVLDFVNTAEEIQEAFRPYYEATILDEGVDANLIYDTKISLRSFNLYSDLDIDRFIRIFNKDKNQSAGDLGKLSSILKPIVDTYVALPEDKRFEFKKTANNFIKWYAYITQLYRVFDKEVQNEYYFILFLLKMLPSDSIVHINLEDTIALVLYELKQTFDGPITPPSNGGYAISLPKPGVSDFTTEEAELLDAIIEKVNERYNGDFTDADKVMIETIYTRCVKANQKLKSYAETNEEEVFSQSIFPKIFKDVTRKCYSEQVDAFTKLFQHQDFYNVIMEEIAYQAYLNLRQKTKK